MTYGTAYMPEYQQLNDGWIDVDDEQKSLVHRWSNYLQVSIRPSDTMSLHSTSFFQPRFNEFDDMRILSESSLIVDASEWLSVKIAFVINWDSDPLRKTDDSAALEELDTTLETSLVVKL